MGGRQQISVKQFFAPKEDADSCRRQQGTGKAYAPCPVCHRTYAVAFINSHIDRCLGKASQQQTPQRPPSDPPDPEADPDPGASTRPADMGKVAAGLPRATPAARCSAKRERSGAGKIPAMFDRTPRQGKLKGTPRYMPCLVCNAQVPTDWMFHHLEAECRGTGGATPGPPNKRQRGREALPPAAEPASASGGGGGGDLLAQPPASAAQDGSLGGPAPAPASFSASSAATAGPPSAALSGSPGSSGWDFLMHRQPRPEYGVHTGLRGGWRVTRATGVELLAAMDAAASEDEQDNSEAAEARKALRPAAPATATEVAGAEGPGGASAQKGGGWALLTGLAERSLRCGAFLSQSSNLPGHFVIENFISMEEEAAVISFLDADSRNPWRPTKFNGNTIEKRYGADTNLRTRTTGPGRFDMPEVLRPMMDRMRKVGLPVLRDFRPNECNAIDYRRQRGHELTAHVDDRQLSGDVICNLSLCGDCLMTYTKEKGIHSVDVRLPRRSLQVQANGVRYEYQHSIANSNLLDDRRVSVTFRECPIRETPLFHGPRYIPMRERFKWGQQV